MIQWKDIKREVDAGPWSTNGEPGINGINGINGSDGRDGERGLDAETIRPMGAWTRIRNYKPLDLVTHLGSSYLAKTESKNKTPRDGDIWQLIAESVKGQRGEAGPQGNRGRRNQQTDSDVQISQTFVKGQPLAIVAGSYVIADAVSPTASVVVGFSSGTTGVRLEGTLTNPSWNLSLGDTYYLALGGGITNTAPTANGQAVVAVGRALTPQTLSIEIAEPVLL